ncbi:MAG TPA: DUF4097 family beta strand repeat-containing protein [Candidatus Saccharimonadales bacterium]|nr:DUF4097 family beta strand repeat-containing protein [Candidatus Saccharimonadales bacterium]
MKNFYQKVLNLLLLSFTIPIETKISIPKLPSTISSFFSRNKEEIIHKEFNHIKKLELLCEHGNVSIKTWKQPCVLVELLKNGSQLFLQNVTLQCTVKDDILQVSTIMQDDSLSGTVKFEILVPETLPIKVATTQNDIIINDLSGAIDAQTTSGTITILQGTNTVLAKTTNGNIIVQRQTMLPQHALNLYSEDGDITVAIPQSMNCDIQAQTTHGKIQSDLFITLRPPAMLINDETLNELKHTIHGYIGQVRLNEDITTMLLRSEFGTVKIIPYNSQKK